MKINKFFSSVQNVNKFKKIFLQKSKNNTEIDNSSSDLPEINSNEKKFASQIEGSSHKNSLKRGNISFKKFEEKKNDSEFKKKADSKVSIKDDTSNDISGKEYF